MVNSKRHLFTFLLLIFVITLTACGKGSMSLDVNLDPGDTEQNQKTLTGISISTTESTLTTDSTTALTLIATYDDNTSENITTDVTWSVNEPRVATISNTGLIHTELYVASFSVTAEFQGRTITHTFTSVPAADAVLVNIVLTDNVDLTIPQDIVVVGEYSDGSIAEALAVTIAPTDSQAQVAGVVKFVVSDNTYSAPMNSTGLTTFAVAAPILNSINVTLSSATVISGERITASAFGNYNNGTNNVSLPNVSWVSTGPVSVDGNGAIIADANVTAAATATVTASLDGIESPAISFTVEPIPATPPALLSINVTLSLATVVSGESITAGAFGVYDVTENNGQLPNVSWVSTGPVSVDGNGTIIADANVAATAAATVTASLDGIESSAISFTVEPVTLDPVLQSVVSSISFVDSDLTLLSGKKYTPQIKATYVDGTELYIHQNIVWSPDNDAVVIVNSNNEITALDVTASTELTATYSGVSATIIVNVFQTDVYDYVVYQINNEQEKTRIENTNVSPRPVINAFNNPSGLLVDMPIPAPFPAYFTTMINEPGTEQLAIAINATVPGSYGKTNSLISYVPDASLNEFYTIDDTTNTSISATLTSIDLSGKMVGEFSAVLCKNSAIKVNTCDAESNRINISGIFSALVDTEKVYNCYSSSSPKQIDEYTKHSYQEVCSNGRSYYTLNTIPGLEYKIETDSIGATVDILALTDNASPIIASTVNGNVQSLTFTATATTSEISFSSSTDATFKLDVISLSMASQGSPETPFMLDNISIPTRGILSVDNTSSFYKLPVANGYLYKLIYTQQALVGTGLVLSTTSNSDFTGLSACNSNACTITAASDFIYLRVDGPVDGYATISIELQYQNDRNRDNYDDALTLPSLPILGFKGQVGDKDVAQNGSVNTLQGSLYWVSGLNAGSSYIVKLSGVDKLTQMWVNDGGALTNSCQAAGNEETTEFTCYIQTSSYANSSNGFSLGVTTNANGTKYIIDIFEITDPIYYVSTYANSRTKTSPFAATEIALYRDGETLPFIRSATDIDRFNSKAFNIKPGEKIFVQVTDPHMVGDDYSIIISDGAVTSSAGTSYIPPSAPDIFESNGDNIRQGATELIFAQPSYHSLVNSDGSFGDQDWFSFTAP